MQSDGNSFCGDVSFDSDTKASNLGLKTAILDRKYEKQILSVLYYEDFNISK